MVDSHHVRERRKGSLARYPRALLCSCVGIFRSSVGVVMDILRVRGDEVRRPLVHYAVCGREARTTRFRLFWVRCHNFLSICLVRRGFIYSKTKYSKTVLNYIQRYCCQSLFLIGPQATL